MVRGWKKKKVLLSVPSSHLSFGALKCKHDFTEKGKGKRKKKRREKTRNVFAQIFDNDNSFAFYPLLALKVSYYELNEIYISMTIFFAWEIAQASQLNRHL